MAKKKKAVKNPARKPAKKVKRIAVKDVGKAVTTLLNIYNRKDYIAKKMQDPKVLKNKKLKEKYLQERKFLVQISD